MDIVGSIFNLVLNLVFLIVNAILLPFDAIINNVLPDVQNALNAIANFLDIVTQTIAWGISATGIPYWVIAFIASYFVMKLTLPLNIWAVKLAVKWYHTIKG